MRTLCQTFVLTPAMKVEADPSVEQPPTNFTCVIKSTNAYVKKNVSLHFINYQNVPIASAIIIGVTLQEYEEYNNLPQ